MAHVHINQGDYTGKHPEGAEVDEKIAAAIREAAVETRLRCDDGSRIARQLGTTMEEVGLGADLLEIKVNECQLGLFGHGGGKKKGRILEPASEVSPELEAAIREAIVDGKLPCITAWELAAKFAMKRIDICAAAEALSIKSSKCQLGVF